MIIASIVGLVLLMIIMFIGIKYYVEQNEGMGTIKQEGIELQSAVKVEYSSTLLILVSEVTEDRIAAFDIESKKDGVWPISLTTKVKDAYGGTIPLASIKKGDIVELVYQEDKDHVISVSKTSRVWSKNKISGVVVDNDNREMTIGDKVYSFSSNTMILRNDDTPTNTTFIGPYDVISVQGIGDVVWSVRIIEAAASINITDLPTREGTLELDWSRMIPLADLNGPIDIIPGKHKVLITLKGYETFNEAVDIKAGEVYELSLKDVKQAYTTVSVALNDTEVDYTIKIGDKGYKKGEEISVVQGTYPITITAEGYKPWSKEVTFEKETHLLKITLQAEAPAEETNEVEGEAPANNAYTINISTDPSGAKVYIDGAYKGVTPYKATVPIGDYSVLFEKDGYEVYTTSIIIDNSDNQNSFLYVLTPTA